MTEAVPLLHLDRVSKTYRAEGPAVLSGITLRLEAGEGLSITGPSGVGKSTLLNLMGGLDEPTDGRICLNGTDLAACSPAAQADLRNQTIGFVFQQHHLLPQCTANENILVPALARHPRGIPAEIRARADHLLEAVGLAEAAAAMPATLSGGMCQRLAVARALINRPRLLLADEPTGSLDPATAEQVVDLLCTLAREEGMALVMVTHADRLAARLPRRTALRNGLLEAL